MTTQPSGPLLAGFTEALPFSLDAFQKGILTSLDLRDSQDKLTQARDSYTSLLIDYKVAEQQFVKVMGGTLGEAPAK